MGYFRDGFIIDEDLQLLYTTIYRLHKSDRFISWLSLEDALKRDTSLSDQVCERLLKYVEAMRQKTPEECQSYFRSVKDNVETHVKESLVKDLIVNSARALKEGNVDLAIMALKDIEKKTEFHERKVASFWDGVEALDSTERELWTRGISLGVYGLDTKTQEEVKLDDYMWFKGGKPGQLMLIQGSSNYGKTTLMLDMSVFHMLTGLRVCFFSLEMQAEYLNYRTYSAITGMTNRDFQEIDREEMKRRLLAVKEQYQWTQDIQWYEYFGQRFTPSTLDLELTLLENEGKQIDVVFLDYLELVDSDGRHEKEYQQAKANAQQLIKIAKRHGVFMIASSQSNRAALREGSSGATTAAGYGKIQVSDFNLTLNRKEEEKYSGHGDGFGYYLTWDKSRFGKSGGTIKLTDVNLEKGQFFDISKAIDGGWATK